MKNKIKALAIATITLWTCFFILLPLTTTFSLSFFTSSAVLSDLTPTLKNFYFIFSSIFIRVLFRSGFYALITSLLCLSIAYPFSYFIARVKYQQFFLGLVIIPFWTSSVIRSYALIGLLKTKGLINCWLTTLGLIDAPLELLYNEVAVIIGLVYNLLPFMILPLYHHFQKIDYTILSAGRDLNASEFYIFKHVIWPLSQPAVNNGILMTFFPAMTLFYIPTILGGAKTLLMGNLIETQFFLLSDWPGGAATSLVLSLLLIAMMLYLRPSQHAS